MHTPGGTGANGQHRETPDNGSGSDVLWQCFECLVGGLTAGVVVPPSLPTLQELARPLGPLSTTGLASVALLVWLFAWATIETCRELIADGNR